LKGQEIPFAELAKVVGERWQTISADERKDCEQQANSAKEEYYAKLARYKVTPEFHVYRDYLEKFRLEHHNISTHKRKEAISPIRETSRSSHSIESGYGSLPPGSPRPDPTSILKSTLPADVYYTLPPKTLEDNYNLPPLTREDGSALPLMALKTAPEEHLAEPGEPARALLLANMGGWMSPSASTDASRSPTIDSRQTPDDLAMLPARAFLVEFLKILQDRDVEEQAGIDEFSITDVDDWQSPEAITQETDGCEAGSSSKTPASSKNASGSGNLKRSFQPGGGMPEEENGDKPSRKKSNRVRVDVSLPGDSILELQLPCPLLESHECLGTDPTISQLLRCLQKKHQIVICNACCTLVEIPSNRKGLDNLLKEHNNSPVCIRNRRCISQSCTEDGQTSAFPHVRTNNCPSWQQLPNDTRWKFIWTLLHPGETAPHIEFSKGVGVLHDTVYRPSTRQPRDKANELCDQFFRVEAKDKRIQCLENELEEFKIQHDKKVSELGRFKLQHDQKVSEMEEIIQDLLERLAETNSTTPQSLQKRLQRVCPNVLASNHHMSVATQSNMLHTPESMDVEQTVQGDGTSQIPAVPISCQIAGDVPELLGACTFPSEYQFRGKSQKSSRQQSIQTFSQDLQEPGSYEIDLQGVSSASQFEDFTDPSFTGSEGAFCG
jgi:hypothetical protein